MSIFRMAERLSGGQAESQAFCVVRGSGEAQPAAQLSPIVAEPFSLPQDDRPRLNKEQSSAPTVPQSRKE